MAQIAITIPDAVVDRVVAALCGTAGVTPTAANAKQVVIRHISQLVRQWELDHAQVDDVGLT